MFSIGERVKYRVCSHRGFGHIVSIDGLKIEVKDEETGKVEVAHINLVQKAKKVKNNDRRKLSRHAKERIKERFPNKSNEEVRSIIKKAEPLELSKVDDGAKSLYDEKSKMVLIVDGESNRLITTYKKNFNKVKIHKGESSEMRQAMEDLKDYEVPTKFDHKIKKTFKE